MMEFSASSDKLKVKIFRNTREIARYFYGLIAEEISASLASGRNYHLCLSGGSTPLLIFDYLKSFSIGELNLKNLHLYWGDERCVPPNHPESNFGNASKTLIKYLNIPEKNIHRMMGENDPEFESERYQEELILNLPAFKKIPCFDLVLLGMGEDGHTASIFPGQSEIIHSEKMVVPNVNPNNGQKRVTLTPRIINRAKQINFIVTGSGKSKLIPDIINRTYDYEKYPASHINPSDGYIFWFLDKDSGALLKNFPE